MDLSAGVEQLKGIGPKTAEKLRKYGIVSVRDLLYNLPKDYDTFSTPVSISAIRPGKIVVRGRIDSLKTRRARRRNLSVTEGVIHDNTGAIKVIWFNQSYRVKQFSPDKEYYFTGDYQFKNGRYSLISPAAAEVSDVDLKSGLSPIYKAHGSIKSHDFKRLILHSKDKFAQIPDLLPSVSHGTRAKALFYTHLPDSMKTVGVARNYLAYEELFELILASKLNRQENNKLKAVRIPFDSSKIKDFVASLPFQLTNAQRRAVWDIFQNIKNDVPMNRLLQGDVGSGKTMVAALAAYGVALAHNQTAILAPTAVLAAQHYNSFSDILGAYGIKVGLLTGATKHKKELKEKIRTGDIDVVIGTHALLTDDTTFSNLSLVVIDEQHRFGVEQRQKLMLKSPGWLAPHLLAMTATPIPRSLQLTVFGDLDVSILDELPSGRKPVKTLVMPETDISEKLYPKIQEIVNLPPDAKKHGAKAKGQQIYWICRAIEDGDKSISETMSVKTRATKLANAFPKLKIATLHGKMKPAEKDEIMQRFSDGEIDILVSTTVVEVGVDVPNATLIVIENADSYGLAQLHQLRGRVGRGVSDSFCYLLTAGDAKPSRRLLELEKSSDGFYLAEVDLRMRGPGEIYGVLQHGALDLRIASLSDTKLIARAQKDVTEFLRDPDNLIKYKELMEGISKYQQITTLN